MLHALILRKLMENEFICPVSYPDYYDYLCIEENYNAAKSDLTPFGYQLASRDDGDVFFAINVLEREEDKKAVTKLFNDIYFNIAPYLDLLVCLAATNEEYNALSMGDILRFDELAVKANSNPDFLSRLNVVAEGLNIPKKNNEEKVAALLNLLENDGLAVKTSPSELVYKITGKISYVYSVIGFANENFVDDFDESELTQEGLGL